MANWRVYYCTRGSVTLKDIVVQASSSSEARRSAESMLGPSNNIQRVTGA